MSPPPTMKNAVYRFGDRTSYKTIKQTTESVPAVRDHEVLVEIHGVTLNYRDLAISKSEYPSTVTEHVVPCSDGAGVVVSVGSAVEDIDVGDRVITNFDVTNLYGPVLNGGSHRLGGVLDGMLRQYAAVPAQAVIKIPEECTLDFVQLASLVCAGVTAWNALYGLAPLRPGQVVLLQGTGGVSIFVTSRSSGGWDFLYIWDDRSNFVENQVLRGSWSFQTLYEMFTMVRLNVFEPLGWLLKFFVVQMVGLDAWWVRVVSGIVHFAAGLVLAKVSALVLDIDYVLTESKRPSVHPIHAVIVAWPSAQPYTLAALFSYSALLVHVQDVHQNLCKSLKGGAGGSAVDSKVLLDSIFGGGSTRSSLLSSALYLCALLSKSISILLPAGFFLVDLKLPSVAILMTFLSVTAISNSEGGLPDVVDLTLCDHVLKAFTAPAWILHRFLWPSKIRPHYQIHPGDYSLDNPDCLLSVAITVPVLALMLRNVLHRDLSKHTLAIAFFAGMLFPVSGLIQHGIITAGANRYAYLPTTIFVPYGGWAATHWLLRGSSPHGKDRNLTSPAWDTPEHEVPSADRHSKPQKTGVSYATVHTGKVYAWAMWLLLTGTLLLISTSVLTHWRNEDSLYEFSLRADPADWKILGQRAEYLLHAERCASNGAECRHLWILANKFSPRGTLKSQLYRLHLLVVLGDAVHACDGYLSLLKDNPDNSSVHNNAAVCFAVRGKLTEARREFSRALQTPTIKDTMATHTKNSRTFDEWEAQHALHSADEWPGFVGTLTY
ncbi:hypothetical protein PRIC1_012424 [Phytophthora ramorum]